MQRNCDVCGTLYEAKRSSSKYCSATCRQRAFASPALVAQLQAPLEQVSDGLEAAARFELQSVGQLASSLGRSALILARRLDNPSTDTGSSIAAVVREYRATLAAAVEAGSASGDEVDDLKAARAKRRA